MKYSIDNILRFMIEVTNNRFDIGMDIINDNERFTEYLINTLSTQGEYYIYSQAEINTLIEALQSGDIRIIKSLRKRNYEAIQEDVANNYYGIHGGLQQLAKIPIFDITAGLSDDEFISEIKNLAIFDDVDDYDEDDVLSSGYNIAIISYLGELITEYLANSYNISESKILEAFEIDTPGIILTENVYSNDFVNKLYNAVVDKFFGIVIDPLETTISGGIVDNSISPQYNVNGFYSEFDDEDEARQFLNDLIRVLGNNNFLTIDTPDDGIVGIDSLSGDNIIGSLGEEDLFGFTFYDAEILAGVENISEVNGNIPAHELVVNYLDGEYYINLSELFTITLNGPDLNMIFTPGTEIAERLEFSNNDYQSIWDLTFIAQKTLQLINHFGIETEPNDDEFVSSSEIFTFTHGGINYIGQLDMTYGDDYKSFDVYTDVIDTETYRFSFEINSGVNLGDIMNNYSEMTDEQCREIAEMLINDGNFQSYITQHLYVEQSEQTYQYDSEPVLVSLDWEQTKDYVQSVFDELKKHGYTAVFNSDDFQNIDDAMQFLEFFDNDDDGSNSLLVLDVFDGTELSEYSGENIYDIDQPIMIPNKEIAIGVNFQGDEEFYVKVSETINHQLLGTMVSQPGDLSSSEMANRMEYGPEPKSIFDTEWITSKIFKLADDFDIRMDVDLDDDKPEYVYDFNAGRIVGGGTVYLVAVVFDAESDTFEVTITDENGTKLSSFVASHEYDYEVDDIQNTSDFAETLYDLVRQSNELASYIGNYISGDIEHNFADNTKTHIIHSSTREHLFSVTRKAITDLMRQSYDLFVVDGVFYDLRPDGNESVDDLLENTFTNLTHLDTITANMVAFQSPVDIEIMDSFEEFENDDEYFNRIQTHMPAKLVVVDIDEPSNYSIIVTQPFVNILSDGQVYQEESYKNDTMLSQIGRKDFDFSTSPSNLNNSGIIIVDNIKEVIAQLNMGDL